MTMDTAGKAVLFSGLTVLISLSAVMLVPSPAFRSMSLGIMLAVIFVLAATLTLLPAVLAKLGPRVDRLALPWVHSGEHRSRALRSAGATALAPAVRVRRPRPLAVLVVLALPVLGLDTGMPSIKVVPGGGRLAAAATSRCRRPSAPGAPGRAPDRRARRRRRSACTRDRRQPIRASPQVIPPQPGEGDARAAPGVPAADPSDPARRCDDRPAARRAAGRARSSAARPPRTTTSRAALDDADAARDRRRARARLPAAAGRAAGAADRGASAWSRTCSPPAPRSARPS